MMQLTSEQKVLIRMTTAVVRPARRKLLTVGVALLAAVVACLTLTATPAHAGSPFPKHQPLACKIDGGGHLALGCGQRLGRPDSWSGYENNHDFSEFNQLGDSRLFPKTDGGFMCTVSENGSMLCSRTTAAAPKPGKDGATISQLRDVAWRGDITSFFEDDTLDCSGSLARDGQSCFKVMFETEKYRAEAIYTYDRATGALNRPFVTWMSKSTGGVVGHSRQFLTASDSPSEYTAPGEMSVTSFAAPGRAAALGSDVSYGVSVAATTAGAAVLDLYVDGFTDASEAVVPTDWVRYSNLDSGVIRYLVPYLSAGDLQSASLHFKAGAAIGSVTARVHAANESTSEAAVSVVPAAPVCTVPAPAPVVPKGGEVTLLTGGVHCDAPAGSVLTTRYDPAAHGDLSLVPQADSPLVYQLKYQARSADYTGVESVPVYAVSTANGEYSEPTMVDIRVVGPAEAVADEYSAAAGTTLVVEEAQGIEANDRFGMGRDGWYPQQGAGPTHGSLVLNPNGSFQYTAQAGYTGDDSFRYRLSGPNGANSLPVTVTIHVTAG